MCARWDGCLSESEEYKVMCTEVFAGCIPCVTKAVHQENAVSMTSSTNELLAFPHPCDVCHLGHEGHFVLGEPIDQMNRRGLSVRESMQTPKT